MTVYVAGSWDARDKARAATATLRAARIECTNAWMDREAETVEELRDCAVADLQELQSADALVVLNGNPSSTGGMHFETGYAFANGKLVVVIGPRTGVFHHLPSIKAFDSLQEFVEWAGKTEP